MRKPIVGTIVALWFCSAFFANAQEKPLKQPGKGVSIEVMLVESLESSGKIVDAKTPTRDEINELDKQGKISRWTRVEIITLEQQQSILQFGERTGAPTKSGSAITGGGVAGAPESGTIVQVTPRVVDDGILVSFLVQQSRPAGQPIPSENKEGGASPKASMVMCDSIVRVPPGQSVVLACQRTDKEPMQTWIVVTAKVIDSK
jgi:type II secretory pathway component GspD/PulD (secretin)